MYQFSNEKQYLNMVYGNWSKFENLSKINRCNQHYQYILLLSNLKILFLNCIITISNKNQSENTVGSSSSNTNKNEYFQPTNSASLIKKKCPSHEHSNTAASKKIK